MLFNTFVFSAIAALAASAQAADSCAAGSIIGIYALCGSFPVDCGKGHCCLEGQKCVTSGSSVACADSALQTGTTLTVNAACYGTMLSHMSTPSGSPTSIPASFVTNPATIATPTIGAQKSGAGGSASGPKVTSALYTFTNGTVHGSGATGTGSATSTATGLALSNGASSGFSSPQNSVAVLLSAVAVVAFWL